MKKELKSLQQRRDEWIRIVNSGDSEAYAGLLAKNAVWIPPEGDPVVGRENFREWLTPFFSRFLYDFAVSNEQIRIADDRAVEKTGFTSEMTPKDGGKPIRHSGTFTVLWHRNADGIWYIERYIDDTDFRNDTSR